MPQFAEIRPAEAQARYEQPDVLPLVWKVIGLWLIFKVALFGLIVSTVLLGLSSHWIFLAAAGLGLVFVAAQLFLALDLKHRAYGKWLADYRKIFPTPEGIPATLLVFPRTCMLGEHGFVTIQDGAMRFVGERSTVVLSPSDLRPPHPTGGTKFSVPGLHGDRRVIISLTPSWMLPTDEWKAARKEFKRELAQFKGSTAEAESIYPAIEATPARFDSVLWNRSIPLVLVACLAIPFGLEVAFKLAFRIRMEDLLTELLAAVGILIALYAAGRFGAVMLQRRVNHRLHLS